MTTIKPSLEQIIEELDSAAMFIIGNGQTQKGVPVKMVNYKSNGVQYFVTYWPNDRMLDTGDDTIDLMNKLMNPPIATIWVTRDEGFSLLIRGKDVETFITKLEDACGESMMI
jgi:hypothetical protein